MIKLFYKLSLVLLILILSHVCKAQLTVDGSLTPQQLVETVLIGNGVSASNITFTGAPTAIGSFNSTNSNVGFSGGILLTTGSINNAIGPNNSGSSGTDNMRPGDTDLNQTVSVNTQDATVLEFDFVPASDTLRFNYVFASEEYLEWVGFAYNDVFGFFISGPGISGPYTNNAINIALVPGTQTPVSISNVNSTQNSAYYFNNETPPPPATAIQYDGFTVPLTAEAIVQCGETYHIKLAIADAGDGTYDSGVFLEAGSFGTSGIQITATGSFSGDTTIVEGCDAALFTFFRPDTTSDFTIHFFIEGTATPGEDYNQIPDSIVIPQGQFTEELVINPFVDGVSEGVETITLRIDFFSGCGNDTLYATIYIQNVDSIKVEKGPDYNICTPAETATLKASATGGYGPLTFTWSNDAGVGDSVVVTPEETTKYFVTVTDSCGNVAYSDSIEVVVQCDVIVPNAFNSGSDYPKNSVFYIENLDQYPGSSLSIYNRWGRKVYESSDYKNDWAGDKLAEGIYFYIVNVSDPEQGIKTGTVTILKN